MPIGFFSHNHVQSVPAVKWTVVHNLGTMAPAVDVIILYEGVQQKIIPQDVKVISKTTVEILFSVARTGTAAIR